MNWYHLRRIKIGFSESIPTCMGKYATFKGRATRSEFWWFYLFTVLICWGATIVDTPVSEWLGADRGSMVSDFMVLIFILPVIAVATRRLHDIGRSGWWQLLYWTIIGIPVVIYWLAKDTEHELVDSES